MSKQDRLAEYQTSLTLEKIKAHRAELDSPKHRGNYFTPQAAKVYIDWLIAEVERLREERGDPMT